MQKGTSADWPKGKGGEGRSVAPVIAKSGKKKKKPDHSLAHTGGLVQKPRPSWGKLPVYFAGAWGLKRDRWEERRIGGGNHGLKLFKVGKSPRSRGPEMGKGGGGAGKVGHSGLIFHVPGRSR